MSANRVTMRDVAKEAGVTSAAVSYALSGKRPISEETRGGSSRPSSGWVIHQTWQPAP